MKIISTRFYSGRGLYSILLKQNSRRFKTSGINHQIPDVQIFLTVLWLTEPWKIAQIHHQVPLLWKVRILDTRWRIFSNSAIPAEIQLIHQIKTKTKTLLLSLITEAAQELMNSKCDLEIQIWNQNKHLCLKTSRLKKPSNQLIFNFNFNLLPFSTSDPKDFQIVYCTVKIQEIFKNFQHQEYHL